MSRRRASSLRFARLRRIACAVTALVAVAGSGFVDATAAPKPSPSGSSSSSSTGSAGKAAGTQRATFGIGPASLSAQNPRGYFSYQMGAGGTYRDRAIVVNYGNTPLRLGIYAADLGNSASGALVVGLPDDAGQHDAGAWVKLPKKLVTVDVAPASSRGPGTKIVPFTLQVPADASPGDHGGALVAVLSTLGRNPKGENVRLNQRVATRLYVRVNGPVTPRLEIDDLRATYHQNLNPIGGGSVTVHYVVRNSGNIRLAAQQVVTVTGMFGTTKTVTGRKIDLLFPHGAQPVNVTIKGVFPTMWEKARVKVTPLLFADQKPVPVPTAARSVSFVAVPWTLLGCVFLLLALTVGFFLRRRRRRRAVRRPEPPGGRGKARGRHRPEPPTPPASTSPAADPDTEPNKAPTKASEPARS